jgi:predicted TIM-barrel fold metal-dependent hydrolase
VLADRDAPPRLRPHDGGWLLELAGEAPFALAAQPEDADRRVAALDDLGVDAALVALSTALGIESLPADEAREIIAAWDADAGDLPGRLRSWGSVALADADPADVDAALDRGHVGITLPSTALETPDRLDRLAPLLERLAERDAPLFVHPGPVAPDTWLPPLTGYVASLSQAWHAWALHGRAEHPELRVVFAALAGLAPLHAERLDARVDGAFGQAACADRRTFYETSSYGPAAVDALAGVVGTGQLVHGSDFPYAAPSAPAAPLRRALLEDNPAALLRTRTAVTA